MSSYPSRPKPTRYGGPVRQPRQHVSQQSNTPIVPILIGICVIAAGVAIIWVLKDRDRQRESAQKVEALLKSADQFIEANQEAEAERLAREALALRPDIPRSQEMLDRIATKRGMIATKQNNESSYALEQAEQTAKGDIAGAIEVFEQIQTNKALSEEGRKAATERINALKAGPCSLQLPSEWPPEAIVSIDGTEVKNTPEGLISGIQYGKRSITVSRFGYREPAPLELDFKGLDTLKYPKVTWKLKGGSVKLVSQPAGAEVWQNGENTGKVTPCDLPDVDAGEVEFVLKHPKHADTTVKGEVKARQATRLSAKLEPKDG